MGWFGVGLALLVPWLAAAVWLRGLWSDVRPGVWPAILGYSYPLALLLVALTLRGTAALGLPFLFMIPLVLMAGLLAVGRRRLWPFAIRLESLSAIRPSREHLLSAILLVWILLRFADLVLELWWQPLFPWDAWTTWLLRARVWSETGHWVPFIAAAEWLADPATQAQTIAAWRYPTAVSFFGLWAALGYGQWSEIAAKVPWIGCTLSLALVFYGQARLWGASTLTALTFLWVLLTLPLVNTHLALAGYADLWLGLLVLMAFSAMLHWVRDGDRHQGLLALVSVLACPLIKQEGMVWMLLFIPALVASRLAWRWTSAFLLMLALAAGVLWINGGMAVESAWGPVELSAQAIQLPLIGRFEILYHDNWYGIWRNLFLYDNWHLFFYACVPMLGWGLWRAVRYRIEPWERSALVFVLSVLAALYLLFFWTAAYRWAEDSTSVARLFMHFVPSFAFWWLTLWSRRGSREAIGDAGRSVESGVKARTGSGDRDPRLPS